MKQTILRQFLFLSMVGICIPAAQAETDIYGKLMLTLQQDEQTLTVAGISASSEEWDVKSHASRFGVKGSTDTDIAGLKAIYQLEWEIDVSDNGKSSDDHIKARNQYVGLKGGFGSLIIGRHDTPLKKAQGKVDLFGDLPADIKNIMEGEVRADNMIQYTSPKIADVVSVSVMLLPGEGDTIGTNVRDGIADGTSIAIQYSGSNLYLAVALDSEVDAKNNSDLAGIGLDDDSEITDTTRLVGMYKGSNFGIGAIFQTSEASETMDPLLYDEEEATFVSGYIKNGAWKFKAQFGSTDNYAGVSGIEKDLTAFGVDYSFSKKTTFISYLVSLEESAASAASWEEDTLGFGIVHKF